jgi:pimeloyl-ACP methyl ester carboxylesterase
MFVRLRRLLPAERVILLDLRGHGSSEKPLDPARYTWDTFASDVMACLDHLGLERAVVGGLSLGANVTLACGMEHPDRCAGLIVEMPVLSGSRGLARDVFGRLADVLERGRRPLHGMSRVVQRLPVPRAIPELAALRDVAGLDPVSGAAVLRGLLDADELPDERPGGLERLTMPTLVIGHRRDPLHLLGDAKRLTAALPRARFVEASSILEFRLRPGRLAAHLRSFLDEAWAAGP